MSERTDTELFLFNFSSQKRRLCIASQLIGMPNILFLDEPTSGEKQFLFFNEGLETKNQTLLTNSFLIGTMLNQKFKKSKNNLLSLRMFLVMLNLWSVCKPPKTHHANLFKS